MNRRKHFLIVVMMLVIALTVSGCSLPNSGKSSADNQNSEAQITDSEGNKYKKQEDGTLMLVRCDTKKEEWSIPSTVSGIKVTAIGKDAFYSTVKVITIPQSVVFMEENPFTHCTELISFNVASENPEYATIDGVLFGKTDKRLICYPRALHSLSYTVPDGIQIIGSHAFFACHNLYSVKIANSVLSIEERAFAYCVRLHDIKLPQKLEFIGDAAFDTCSQIGPIVEIPSSVKQIGYNPFSLCTAIETVLVEKGNERYGSVDGVLFDYNEKSLICYPSAKSDRNYKVSEFIEKIDAYGFACNKDLMSIKIGSNVKLIEEAAFYACEKLRSVEFASGLESIGEVAFWSCEKLSSLTIPSTVKTITRGAFWDCSNLNTVFIEEGVENIGDHAFFSCDALVSVKIPSSVNTIGENAFDKCSDNLTIVVAKDSYAQQYCSENGLKYTVNSNTDWLTNP